MRTFKVVCHDGQGGWANEDRDISSQPTTRRAHGPLVPTSTLPSVHTTSAEFSANRGATTGRRSACTGIGNPCVGPVEGRRRAQTRSPTNVSTAVGGILAKNAEGRRFASTGRSGRCGSNRRHATLRPSHLRPPPQCHDDVALAHTDHHPNTAACQAPSVKRVGRLGS